VFSELLQISWGVCFSNLVHRGCESLHSSHYYCSSGCARPESRLVIHQGFNHAIRCIYNTYKNRLKTDKNRPVVKYLFFFFLDFEKKKKHLRGSRTSWKKRHQQSYNRIRGQYTSPVLSYWLLLPACACASVEKKLVTSKERLLLTLYVPWMIASIRHLPIPLKVPNELLRNSTAEAMNCLFLLIYVTFQYKPQNELASPSDKATQPLAPIVHS
jgi:hypothetical protein